MAQVQHTPGPWNVLGSIRDVQGYDLYCGSIYPFGEGYRGLVCEIQSADHIGGIDLAEAQANARLIAAAPDLLERATDLIEILDDFRGDFADPAFIEALELLEEETRAALTKAGA